MIWKNRICFAVYGTCSTYFLTTGYDARQRINSCKIHTTLNETIEGQAYTCEEVHVSFLKVHINNFVKTFLTL